MRGSIILSCFLVLSAGVLGCGSSPCADYCDATFQCVGCEVADPGRAMGLCTDACQSGLDAVPDAEGQQAVQDCLRCIAPLYKQDCELSEQSFASCNDECIDAVEPIQIWVEAFGKDLEGETIVCKDGTPIGGGSCTLTSGGDTCSVECASGETMAGAECDGTSGTFTCQCTVGPQQGTSFSADCETLDEDTVWGFCG